MKIHDYNQLKIRNIVADKYHKEYKIILNRLKELNNIQGLALQYYGFEKEMNCFIHFLLCQLDSNQSIMQVLNPDENKFMLFISRLNHPIKDEVVIAIIFSLCMREKFDIEDNEWLFNEPFWFDDNKDTFNSFFNYLERKKIDVDFATLHCEI